MFLEIDFLIAKKFFRALVVCFKKSEAYAGMD